MILARGPQTLLYIHMRAIAAYVILFGLWLLEITMWDRWFARTSCPSEVLGKSRQVADDSQKS